MYLPSTKVLSKQLNDMLEIEKREQIKIAGSLFSIAQLYTALKMKNGKLDLAWLGDIPAVKRWKGSKTYGDLSEYAYELEAEDFYDSFSIHKKALRRDDLNGVRPRINLLATNLVSYEAELVLDAIINGTTGIAYDGQAYFSNRAVNDNLLTGSGITLANIMADIATAMGAMQQFQTDKGRFTRYIPDTILCPTVLYPIFQQILNSTSYPGGTNDTFNPYRGLFRNIIQLPDLNDANDWYIFASQYSVKPFIFGYETLENGQKVLPVLDDTKLASDGTYGYSAEMSGKAGYGFYEMAIKVVNA